MITARASHTATLLSNGRVLVLGGNAGASAELYDPISGTFNPTGERTVSGGIATLLNDGRVFIASIPNAELYDPQTGRFTATVAYSGASPAIVSTVVRLADGRVLINGGAVDEVPPLWHSCQRGATVLRPELSGPLAT
jgi:hypothetical protein